MSSRNEYLSTEKQEALVRELRSVADQLIVSSRSLSLWDALTSAGFPDRCLPHKALTLELPEHGLPYMVGFGVGQCPTFQYPVHHLADDVRETLYAFWNIEVLRSGVTPYFIDVWLVEES